MSTSSSKAKRPRKQNQSTTKDTDVNLIESASSNQTIHDKVYTYINRKVKENESLVLYILGQIKKTITIQGDQLQKLSTKYEDQKLTEYEEQKSAIIKQHEDDLIENRELVSDLKTQLKEYKEYLANKKCNAVRCWCEFLNDNHSQLTQDDKTNIYRIIADYVTENQIFNISQETSDDINKLIREKNIYIGLLLKNNTLSTAEKNQLLLTIYTHDLDNLNIVFIRRYRIAHSNLYNFLLESIDKEHWPNTGFDHNILYTTRVEFFKKVIIAYGFTQYKKTKF